MTGIALSVGGYFVFSLHHIDPNILVNNSLSRSHLVISLFGRPLSQRPLYGFGTLKKEPWHSHRLFSSYSSCFSVYQDLGLQAPSHQKPLSTLYGPLILNNPLAYQQVSTLEGSYGYGIPTQQRNNLMDTGGKLIIMIKMS